LVVSLGTCIAGVVRVLAAGALLLLMAAAGTTLLLARRLPDGLLALPRRAVVVASIGCTASTARRRVQGGKVGRLVGALTVRRGVLPDLLLPLPLTLAGCLVVVHIAILRLPGIR